MENKELYKLSKFLKSNTKPQEVEELYVTSSPIFIIDFKNIDIEIKVGKT